MKNYDELHNLERTHWWFVGRRKILYDVLNSFIPSKVERALEVGCSTGANVPLLSAKAKQITVIEMSEDAALLCTKSAPEATVVHGMYPHVRVEGTFDLIAFFDCLEHIEDDAGALRHAESMLAPGGFIIFTVPAFGFLWSEHDVLEGHYRRYKKRLIRSLVFRNTGLKIRRLSYFNISFFFPVVFFRLIKNLFRIRTESPDTKIPLPMVNTIAARLFGFERWPLRFFDFPFGISLICVAQKMKP